MPVLDLMMPWGKYKGTAVANLPLGYLAFLIEKGHHEKDPRLAEEVEKAMVARLVEALRSRIQFNGESVDMANARHDREKGEDGAKRRKVAAEFAWWLVRGDPQALDMLEDVMQRL